MAKSPIEPIIKMAKATAPKVIEYTKENPTKVLGAAVTAFGTVKKLSDAINNNKEERFEKNKGKGKVPYRHLQYIKYNNEILPNLNSFSYVQLISYKNEIEDFIEQIQQEEMNEMVVINKLKHSKRSKSWRQILIQIEGKIRNRNYEEFYNCYNSTTYESNYFDFKVIDKMYTIDNLDDLHSFIYSYTEKDMKDIKRDFS